MFYWFIDLSYSSLRLLRLSKKNLQKFKSITIVSFCKLKRVVHSLFSIVDVISTLKKKRSRGGFSLLFFNFNYVYYYYTMKRDHDINPFSSYMIYHPSYIRIYYSLMWLTNLFRVRIILLVYRMDASCSWLQVKSEPPLWQVKNKIKLKRNKYKIILNHWYLIVMK